LDLLADANLLWVMPTESESGFNPAKTMIGSGPWLFESYTPSVSFKFKKNPNWFWKSGFPLMDAINIPIIPEYATRLAQFQAGGIDYFAPNSADLVALKANNKDTQLASEVPQVITLFYFDNEATSPWRDPRVRQAI